MTDLSQGYSCQERLLSWPRVREITGISRTTAWRLSRGGDFPKPVQISATVGAVAPGAGMPTGTVQFSNNGTVIGSASLVDGVATITVTFRKGTHPLTAMYAGDGNFTGSSGARAQVVK